MKNKMNVAVLIYDYVELVDMNGPLDVFLHANSYNGSRYTVYTVSANGKAVTGEGGVVKMTPGYSISNCPVPDIVVIPGIMKDGVVGIAAQEVLEWLKKLARSKKTIMSVCIGIYTLAKTGLLKGKKATTHYLSINDFHTKYPDVQIVKNVRFVQDGLFVTTGGVTSGIDGALQLVEKLDGADVAQQTADVMVYNREGALPPYTLLPPYFS